MKDMVARSDNFENCFVMGYKAKLSDPMYSGTSYYITVIRSIKDTSIIQTTISHRNVHLFDLQIKDTSLFCDTDARYPALNGHTA